MMSRSLARATPLRVLAVFLCLSLAAANGPAQDTQDSAALLERADRIKTSSHAEFAQILQSLEQRATELPAQQREHVHYLRGWQEAYLGNYERALAVLKSFVATATDPALEFRARATMVNVLAIARRYQEAFSELNDMLEGLHRVSDEGAREQGLTVAALLYGDVGQHDLSLMYSEKVIEANVDGRGLCRGSQLKMRALYESTPQAVRPTKLEPEIQRGIEACVAIGELTYANVIRGYLARLRMERGELQQALDLLTTHYDEVTHSQYPRLISQYDVLIAQIHWQLKDSVLARQFALRAVEGAVKNEFTEPLVAAYRLLYAIDKARGLEQSALEYHEKYMAADKGYLDDIGARQLAYERVQHEVAANKLQIESLKLQRELDAKEIENVRLYVALLIVILGFIAFWAYRTKRSQLHFMNLSRRDGLTGIINRPHFMELAASTLENCRKLKQDCAIVLCDLDHFKQINDRYGHAEGDNVLKRMVAACQSHMRAADIFARVGGEEFCILLPACGVDDARERAEELRKAIADISSQTRATISASLGVTGTAISSYDLQQLLAHADTALYQAKRSGRDRVIVYDKDSVVMALRPTSASTAP